MNYKEPCPSCGGWREDKTWRTEGKTKTYYQCMTCGEIEDGEGNKYSQAKRQEKVTTKQQGEDSD